MSTVGYIYYPTTEQMDAMKAVKALHPEYAWFQLWTALQTDYPNDFKDNNHDIYVVMNNFGTIPPVAGVTSSASSPDLITKDENV